MSAAKNLPMLVVSEVQRWTEWEVAQPADVLVVVATAVHGPQAAVGRTWSTSVPLPAGADQTATALHYLIKELQRQLDQAVAQVTPEAPAQERPP